MCGGTAARFPWGRHFMAAMPTMFSHGVEGLGHFSIEDHIVPAILELLDEEESPS